MNGKTDGDNFWKVKYQRRAQHCQRFPLTSCFIGDLDSEKFLLSKNGNKIQKNKKNLAQNLSYMKILIPRL